MSKFLCQFIFTPLVTCALLHQRIALKVKVVQHAKTA